MRIKYSATIFLFFILVVACDFDLKTSESGNVGQGGSMSRFAIQGNYMYVANSSSLQVFDLTAGTFNKVGETYVGFRLETIFAKPDYLYLGAADGMYIYSLAKPDAPSFIFRYAHILSCDPVVVQGTTAYITMRSGTQCNRGINMLDIVDISNPNNPVLIRSYDMESPHGLGVDGSCLFLCDGANGLKMYDVKNPNDIHLIKEIKDIDAYDVIPRNGLLTLTGKDGIFQYSYNCELKQVTLLSKIPVERDIF
jgi:hypothetical protein